MRRQIFVTLLLVGVLGCGTAPVAPSSSDEKGADTNVDKGGAHDLSGASGSPLSSFSLKDYRGKKYAVDSHIGKDVIMVSFWATWCGPCKSELEAMVPIYDELKDRGFVYLAISTDGPETVSEVADYVRTYGYEYPVLLDQKSTVLNRFNPRGDLPYYLLVNRRGEIVEQHQGSSLGDEVKIRKKILSLL